MKKNLINPLLFGFIISLLSFFPTDGNAQDARTGFSRDTLMKAAREIITGNPYCALVTMDSTGQPQVRTMNPFPLGDEIVIWFATSRKSRKVKEIRNNPKVSVYYADHSNAKGYVNITGTAEIIDDKALLISKKREYWNGIPNWQDKFVLIKITPVALDVISYAKGIGGDPETNRSPVIIF